jgi:hypothetical protein
VSKDAWDERVCPHCGEDVSDDDFARVEAQASATEAGRASLHHPEGWWTLSCGHLVDSWVERITGTPDEYKFKLVDLES